MIRLLKIYLTLVFLLVTTFGMAQKSELKFSKDGKFKIVQFTDVHFKYGNRASDIALERINPAPLDEICKLAEKYDALVMVDECHSAGVLGKTGRKWKPHC